MADARRRWILVGSILGSGAVFVEGTVTTVALPTIGRDFDLGIAGLQWVMNGYLLTLSALILFGGSVGDRFQRRCVFSIGLGAFAVTSLACAAAPNVTLLVIARVLQGIAGALVVPNSLALLETTFSGEARGAAIGRWAAWSAVSTAFGPLVGGWLVDIGSWRLVFMFAAPFAIAAMLAVSFSHEAEHRTERKRTQIDYAGATLVTLGLAGIVGALVIGPDAGFSSSGVLAAGISGVVLLGGFVLVEHRSRSPLLPLDVFRLRQFVGVNAATLFVYAALSGLVFLLMLQLQNALGYSALAAGTSLLPINGLMLLLSPWAGRIAERRGPRAPMVAGALVAACGMLLFMRVRPGAGYAATVLPAAVVFGLGLSCLVAPLTSVALGALEEQRAGLASGVNNAVARLAGLLAIAVIPLAAGLGGARELSGSTVSRAFPRAMLICAALCAAGGLISAVTISDSVRPGARPG